MVTKAAKNERSIELVLTMTVFTAILHVSQLVGLQPVVLSS